MITIVINDDDDADCYYNSYDADCYFNSYDDNLNFDNTM